MADTLGEAPITVEDWMEQKDCPARKPSTRSIRLCSVSTIRPTSAESQSSRV